MFLEKNKILLAVSAGVILVWVCVYYFSIKANWEHYDETVSYALEQCNAWEAVCANAGKKELKKEESAQLLERHAAEQHLKEHNAALKVRFDALQKIEFGTPETLKPYSEAAAGANDPKNYLSTVLKQTVEKSAKSYNIAVPSELNLFEKASDDPVSLSLMRVAMVDRFITACKEAGVPEIIKIQYSAPQVIAVPDNENADDSQKNQKPAEAAKSSKAKEKEKGGEAQEEEPPVERLVQLPMKVLLKTPERFLGQLLFELQKPSDSSHGYFSIGGYHVAVRDAGSGKVEAAVAVSALLKESQLKALHIPYKDADARGGGSGRQVDLNRGGY